MKMSERVEREFKEWQERYDIPYKEEFRVKTLLTLQEEYDSIIPADNNTRTRESILKMINEIYGKFSYKMFEEKKKYNLYYDFARANGQGDFSIFVFCEDKIHNLKGVSMETAANYICSVAKAHNCEIYGDINGFGHGIADHINQNGFTVNGLKIVKNNK